MADSTHTVREAQRALYELIDSDRDLEAKIQEALKLGQEFLGVDNAHLTRIDPENDYWGALQSTDPPSGDFPPGIDLDLDTTYCRRVIEAGETIALHDAPEQGWAEDPAYQEHGLHCYHGTPIDVAGDVYGTLCFVSKSPRPDPFTEAETLFAETIARELEYQLEHSQLEAESIRRANSVTVLSRVLRHNLRNDMTVVRGHISALAEQLDEWDPALLETALRKSDEIIDLSAKARKLETVIASRLDREPVDLREVLARVARDTSRDYPDAEIDIDWVPESPTIMAMDTLETAFAEVVENAAKHGGDDPAVTISVAEATESVTIEVTDTGPGIPQNERAVLQEGVETPLVHGSGLGLWMVYWIVTNHDGTITASPSDDGTTVRITLPRVQQDPGEESEHTEVSRGLDLFQALFEESRDAIVISNDDGRFVDVNPAAAELFGLDRKDLLGRTVAEFVPGDIEFEARWQAFVATGADSGTLSLTRPDGNERVAEYAATADIVPGRHLLIIRDVTERQRRKKKLEESHHRFETLVENFPNGGILVFDDDLCYRNVGGVGFDELGIDPEQWEGQHISDLLDGDLLHTVEEMYEATLDGEYRTQQLEFGGHLFDVHTMPLVNDSGDVFGGIVMTQLVDERVGPGTQTAKSDD